MESFTVAIIIPNWNGKKLLEKHLGAILSAANKTPIIVVDDASLDDSVSYIQSNFPEITVVQKDRHEGFASTVNVGVSHAVADIVVLLNTDVVPTPGFLSSLLVHFQDESVFAVGCLEKSHEKGKVITRGRGLAHWVKGFYVHSRGEVDQVSTAWVSGGSGAFRKKVWNKLGGMSELFNPFYWEDIDLSYRARKDGYKVVFESKSVVDHFHEEGKIITEYSATDVRRIAFRNQLLFTWLNVNSVGLLWSHMVWLPIRIVQSLLKGDTVLFQGYIAAVLLLPKVGKERNVRSRFWRIPDEKIVT